MPEDALHEHKCSQCSNYWSCRQCDCDPFAVCRECEDKQLEEWVNAHDPQPELQLTGEDF